MTCSVCHLCFWFGDTYYTFLQLPLRPDPTSTLAPWNSETQMSQRYPKELGSITKRLLYVDAVIDQRLYGDSKRVPLETYQNCFTSTWWWSKEVCINSHWPAQSKAVNLPENQEQSLRLQLYTLSTPQKIHRICERASNMSAKNRNK